MTQDTSSGLYLPGEAPCPPEPVQFCPMGTLAERLDEAMTLRGKKVADLIRDTGLSKAAIHFVLNGTTKAETIRAVNVDKLCEALEVDRDWLLYGHGAPEAIGGAPSHSVGLDVAILLHADWWVQYEEAKAGVPPVAPPDRRDDYLRRLAHVYALAEANGGRLSSAHADEIINALQGESNGRSTKDRGNHR